MSKNSLIFLFFLSFAVIPQASNAGFITFETSTTVTIKDKNAKVVVVIVNLGDEPAHNIRINAQIGGKKLSGQLKSILRINEKHREELTMTVDFKKPGRYPVIVTVEYTDTNLYPFSVLSVGYLNYKKPLEARVAGILSELTLTHKGRLNVTVNNTDLVERKIYVQVVASKEFITPAPKDGIVIGSGTEKTIYFDIKNISALLGSDYPVFAIISYEDDRYFYSNISAGNIKIERERFFTIYNKPLIILLIIILIIAAYYTLIKSRGKNLP